MNGDPKSDAELINRVLMTLAPAESVSLIAVLRDRERASAALDELFRPKLTLRKCWSDPDPGCKKCNGKGSYESFFDSYTAQSEYERCECVKFIPKPRTRVE